MRTIRPYTLYLIMEGTAAFFFMMMAAASNVYMVTDVGLNPLQLVLVGTALELSVFVFEVPTGVVADTISRRLSIIIGFVLVGVGLVVWGAFPVFAIILLAQVIWGVGYTFTSGAIEAWITDEIGVEQAGPAFLRANQVGLVFSLLGIAAGAAVGNFQIALPLYIAGGGYVLLALFLIGFMHEDGFTPAPRSERQTWDSLSRTTREAASLVRTQPVLQIILLIAVIYGIYSEGIDRLWTPYLLEDIVLPEIGALQPVVWVGLVRGGAMLFSIGVTELLRRRIDMNDTRSLGRALLAMKSVVLIGTLAFGLARQFVPALIAIWTFSIMRRTVVPLRVAWINQYAEKDVRATLLSAWGQSGALGEIAGGPIMGVIGTRFGLRTVMLLASALIAPMLGLYGAAIKQSPAVVEAPAPAEI